MNICKKCHKEFPNRIKIDGKFRSVNRRSYCIECSPFGKNNRRKLELCDGDNFYCSKCNKCLDRHNFYWFGKNKSRRTNNCIKCHKLTNLENKTQFKILCLNYKGGKCEMCGYNKCIQALDFHHNDPSEKDFGIARYRGITLTPNVKKELDKCIVVCSNCHREIHYLKT